MSPHRMKTGFTLAATALAVLVALQVTAESDAGTPWGKSAAETEMEGGAICILPPAEARLDYKNVAPESVQAMLALEKCVKQSGLKPSLLVLVKLRSSQINGWNRLNIAFRAVPSS